MERAIEPTTPIDVSVAPAATVTYKDLKRQRRDVGVDALIFYENDWYNQKSFHETHGGGTWTYVASEVKIYDPETLAYTDVTPSK